ncbi:MAG: ribonuclease P protein component [Xanthomonadales bacterium]|nr:ribonuclease P protein component [Xanthomonadales bacterium]
MKFGRDVRLTAQHEFRRVFARPKVAQDGLFRILVRPSTEPRSRLGMAVSVKVCKQAPGRNRLKRIIRESFRQHQEQLNHAGPCDLVVLPRYQATTRSNDTLFNSLSRLWARSTSLYGRAERATSTEN